jgi:SAM-dependent methyltransferase
MVSGNTLRHRIGVCYRGHAMTDTGLPDHVQKNRTVWDKLSAGYAGPGERAWASTEPTWGIWQLLEREVRALPDVDGKDVIELGCGTAYWSAWLTRRGARVVGIDNSAKQLETARALQEQHGLDFPLLHGNAESVPLPDASFDLALSEYGASLWCDPYCWVPEAARLLRPGGDLVFLKNGTILTLCVRDDDSPATDRLRRDSFGLHRLEWADTGTVEFALPIGEWLRLLRANGFELLDLIELRAPLGASTSYTFVTPEWAHRWPSEEIWILRKRTP